MKRSASLSFIFVTLLVDVLGSGLLVPILPGFIGRLSHHGISQAARDYGWLLSLYGAMQFLFAPLFGALSDRYGRRPILLLSMLFTGLDYTIMALAPSLPWLYFGRILSGITGASYTAATAYIADISPPEKRAQNFGLVGAAFGVGFIIGPAAGGFLGAIDPRLPFWTAAGLSLANMLYGFFVLPESHAAENRRRFQWRETSPVGAMVVLGKYPIVWGLTGALAVSNLGMQCLNSTWVLFTTAKFHWTVRENGIALAAFGLIALVSQVGLSRLLLPWLGERRAMLLGLGVGAFECAAYALVPSGWMIYPVMVLGAVGFVSGQATQGLLSRQVSEREQGALQGALASLASLTGILGPVIGSSIFAYFTGPHTPLYLPGASFLLTAALSVVAFWLSVRTLRRLPSTPAHDFPVETIS